MALRRPPQHRADAVPLFISAHDDAWDHERVKRERVALKNEGGRHPFDVYRSGETRHDIDARVTVAGCAASARDYLREGATPTVFVLRRDASLALKRSQALAVWGDPAARTAALWELVRYGVAEIAEGFAGGAPGARWALDGGGLRPLADTDLQGLHDIGEGLVTELGLAVLSANAPLSDTEGKP